MSETGKARLVSLDVLRGLTVLGMILVNSMAALNGPETQVFPLLLHAHWQGLTIADLVFPGFLMMMGVAVPLAMAGREGSTKESGAILARTSRLFLLGFFLSNLYWFANMESG